MARLIRASEIGEYVYCHRAWWLRVVEGRVPDNQARLRAGTAAHRRHGRGIALSRLLLAAGLGVVVLGLTSMLLGS